MGSIFTKSRGITIALTLVALAAINKVAPLAPVKKIVNGQ